MVLGFFVKESKCKQHRSSPTRKKYAWFAGERAVCQSRREVADENKHNCVCSAEAAARRRATALNDTRDT